ncbi:putative Protein kinase domain-containing protein [Seiridium unicorne]|uniref:Protein kinase domain-containing protein n=1 Tax=Seiridium unicorne TaxID=138068 RepID=A0ABR2VDT6_9PEZI
MAETRSLSRRIWDSLQKERPDSKDAFLPLGSQNDILNHDLIRSDLMKVQGHLHGGTGRIFEYVDSSGRQLYAILAMIEKQGTITDLMNQGIKDEHLPFQRPDKHAASFELVPKDHKGSFSYFQNWTTSDIDKFGTYQWYMISPKFKKGALNMPMYHDLQDGIILPWLSRELVERYPGGNSDVWKIEIHKSHHDFHQEKSNYFAIKALHSKDKGDFEVEFENMKKLKSHNNLVNLLSAFSHKGTFNFLFPWANGGNLKAFWEEHPDPEFEVWVLWVAKQCAGLADGLAEIHVVRPLLSEKSGIRNPTWEVNDINDDDKNFGRHGDIKPENVLLFHNDRNNEGNQDKGTLKLCDFGLTVFHSLKSKSLDRASGIALPLTYNAPEADSDRTISRRYDTWCLGCLYLELITWLLLGVRGLNEFKDKRRGERGARHNFLSDQFFKLRDSKKGRYGIRKNAVVNWIKELQNLESCSDFIYDFLQFVKDHMLQSNESKRVEGYEVRDHFRALQDKCSNENYLLRKSPTGSGHEGSSTGQQLGFLG